MKKYGRSRKEVRRDSQERYGKMAEGKPDMAAREAFERPAYGSYTVDEYLNSRGIEIGQEDTETVQVPKTGN